MALIDRVPVHDRSTDLADGNAAIRRSPDSSFGRGVAMIAREATLARCLTRCAPPAASGATQASLHTQWPVARSWLAPASPACPG